MGQPSPQLLRHLKALSYAYALSVSNDYRHLKVHRVKLPPGFNASHVDVLIDIPADYPMSPPGVGNSRIYLPCGLRFRGKPLEHLYEGSSNGRKEWAWFCYRGIRWNPCQDDLIRLMELNRVYLTNPLTK